MTTSKPHREIVIVGQQIVDACCTGTLLFLESRQSTPPRGASCSTIHPATEVDRYRAAVIASREELSAHARFVARDGDVEMRTAFDSHLQVLDDYGTNRDIEEKIYTSGLRAEMVFAEYLSSYQGDLGDKRQHYCVATPAQSVLHQLAGGTLQLNQVRKGSIIYLEQVDISIIFHLLSKEIVGLVTKYEGLHSHIALIMRSKGIPYLSQVAVETIKNYSGSPALLNGESGRLIIYPSRDSIRHFLGEYTHKTVSILAQLKKLSCPTSMTKDGHVVEFFANTQDFSECKDISPPLVKGIGLVRSELLFAGQSLRTLSEEKQFVAYQRIIHEAAGRPVTIRVFDSASDKAVSNYGEETPSSFLRSRGIRSLLQHPEIFLCQLRALLRTAADGDVRILLPMVADVGDLIGAKSLLQKARMLLKSDGHDVQDNVPLGCMLELPSSIILCDHISSHCDFLAIGTNDLVQYATGHDRSAQEENPAYHPLHPSLFRMIQQALTVAAAAGTPVSVCGEVASNVRVFPVLLGLGVRIFSCIPSTIPQLHARASKISCSQAACVAQEILQLGCPQQVERAIERFSRDINA